MVRLLRSNAPPEWDPLFWIRVLEERERRQFRRRVAGLLGAVLGVMVIWALGAGIGGRAYEVARTVAFCIALATAVAVYGPLLMRALGRLRV